MTDTLLFNYEIAYNTKCRQVQQLEKENAAANKRIEELTAKNLKLLNENNDLWDKVNNPKMKAG